MEKTKVTTGKCRLSYVNVFKARTNLKGDKEEYSVVLLIPKKDKASLDKIKGAIAAAMDRGITDKWKGKKPKNLWNPLRDGDEDKADEHPEYAGMYYLNAKSTQKPLVIDRDKDEILDTTEVYSGCYGRAVVNFYAFSNSGNDGVGCGLLAVQKVADGEPLGGTRATADDFDDLEDDDDDDPLG